MRPALANLLPFVLLGVQQAQAQNATNATAAAKQPNVVLIMTDDQDLHYNSLDHMPVVQRELVKKGTQFTSHYATVAQCCPARASLLRGQAAHNTNITNVKHPGGDFSKWVLQKEGDQHLPVWLADAGYNTEYLGKFLNGYDRASYMKPLPGWTHRDILVDPFVYSANRVVMSENGKRPVHYPGYHQLDVIRAKALDRLDKLAADDKPFYLTIAPAAPHVDRDSVPTPQTRHNGTHKDVAVPKSKNWNTPDDAVQGTYPAWLKRVPLMSQKVQDQVEKHHQLRLDSLLGVDEIVEDVLAKLEDKGILDNTYVVYTTDNGYHLGAHRVAGGKTLPYREDTNLPLIVRGPGVPAGETSRLPSTHIDFPPTFLDIAGVDKADFPAQLDGRSMLGQWRDPEAGGQQCREGDSAADDTPEIINVEFWGTGVIENLYQKPEREGRYGGNQSNTYKTLRVVGEDHSYLYSKWCTGDAELYDTKADPEEVHNLVAGEQDKETSRLVSRLNALLLATKTCADQTCRNPWKILQPGRRAGELVEDGAALEITCLEKALDPKYDAFFDAIPRVAFQECRNAMVPELEAPFLPENPGWGLGHRAPLAGPWGDFKAANNCTGVPGNAAPQGSEAQRSVSLEEIVGASVDLTDEQLGLKAGLEHAQEC